MSSSPSSSRLHRQSLTTHHANRGPNGSPKGTCENSKYSVGFGANGQSIQSFTIEVERVEATAVQGEFSVDDEAADTKWTCTPQPGAVQCTYDGNLIVPV